jgi:ribosomal protein S27E
MLNSSDPKREPKQLAALKKIRLTKNTLPLKSQDVIFSTYTIPSSYYEYERVNCHNGSKTVFKRPQQRMLCNIHANLSCTLHSSTGG